MIIADGLGANLWYRNSTMADNEKEDAKKDAKMASAYAHTRKSLIAKLDNWEDQRTWDEFYNLA